MRREFNPDTQPEKASSRTQNSWIKVGLLVAGVAAISGISVETYFIRDRHRLPHTIAADQHTVSASSDRVPLSDGEAADMAAKAVFQNDRASLAGLEAGVSTKVATAEYGMGLLNKLKVTEGYVDYALTSEIQTELAGESFPDQKAFADTEAHVPASEVKNRHLEAIRFWRIAASQGDAAAKAELGSLYFSEILRSALLSRTAGFTPQGDSPTARAFNSAVAAKSCATMMSLLNEAKTQDGSLAPKALETLALVHLNNLSGTDDYLAGTACDQYDGDDASESDSPGQKLLISAAKAGDEGATYTLWKKADSEGDQSAANTYRNAYASIEMHNADLGFPTAKSQMECLRQYDQLPEVIECMRTGQNRP